MANSTNTIASNGTGLPAKEVIVGSGALGKAVVEELLRRDREPLVINRSGGSVSGLQVVACADGNLAKVLESIPLEQPITVFMCAAPAYDRWPQEFPALIESVSNAVKGRICKLIYADNLYGCGEAAGVYNESSALSATNIKGKVRADATRALMGLHGSGAVEVATVRASTMFGPEVEQSALGGTALRAAINGQPVPLLGDPSLPHTLTYVSDFAACMVAVSEHEQGMGNTWLVPNTATRSLREWLTDFAPDGKVKERVAGRFLVTLIGIFNSQMRELKETLYQFEKPHVVDASYSEKTLGLSPTPVAETIAATKAWLAKKP